MSASCAINRRDIFLLHAGRGRRSIELSCEQVVMKYLNAHLDVTTAHLFTRLDNELQST